jgi:hypothetical protein
LTAGCLQPGDAAQLCLDYAVGGGEWLLPSSTDLDNMFVIFFDTEYALTGEYYWNAIDNGDGTANVLEVQNSTPGVELNFDQFNKDALASVRAVKYHR